MSPPFRVQWEGECFLCKNPVEVRVVIDSYDTLSKVALDMTMFAHYHPIYIYDNEVFWKTRGGKAYKCCRWCGDRPWPIPNLRRREETGVRRSIRSGSKTMHDIYYYFKSLNIYMNMDPDGKFEPVPIEILRDGPPTGIILSMQ